MRALLVALAAVGALALLWALPLAHQGARPAGSAALDEAVAEGDSTAVDLEAAERLAQGLEALEAREISEDAFLAELGDAEPADGSGARAVTWRVEADVDEAAARTVERYAAADGMTFETGGYLDLKGNAWGAVISSERGYVDVLTVAAEEEDGAASRVRVVRLWPVYAASALAAEDADGD